MEEIAKGLGVLILVYSHRSHFDGPVDGIVYAGAVGAGFAFTENILYFGSAVANSDGLLTVFVMRGLFSPFAHVMFTAALGLVVGTAVAKGGGRRIIPAFLLGLVPAIAGHMLWNGGLVVLFTDFFVFYFLIQVPLFGAAVVGVLLLRRAERQLTEHRLGEYAAAGWLTPQEVGMLATVAGRSQGLDLGGPLREQAGHARIYPVCNTPLPRTPADPRRARRGGEYPDGAGVAFQCHPDAARAVHQGSPMTRAH